MKKTYVNLECICSQDTNAKYFGNQKLVTKTEGFGHVPIPKSQVYYLRSHCACGITCRSSRIRNSTKRRVRQCFDSVTQCGSSKHYKLRCKTGRLSFSIFAFIANSSSFNYRLRKVQRVFSISVYSVQFNSDYFLNHGDYSRYLQHFIYIYFSFILIIMTLFVYLAVNTSHTKLLHLNNCNFIQCINF